MGSTVKIAKDIEGASVDSMLYRRMIGSLLYLTASRPDISFSVGVCAHYQSDPKESHLIAVKRIIRYVKGTSMLGLWYPKGTNVDLAAFSDADWAGSADDRKSTSGGCFYLGNCLVAWHSKKQNCISLSTAEVEYIATGSCCTQLLWMKQMLQDYGLSQGAASGNTPSGPALRRTPKQFACALCTHPRLKMVGHGRRGGGGYGPEGVEESDGGERRWLPEWVNQMTVGAERWLGGDRPEELSERGGAAACGAGCPLFL
ncbi:hypothetical protein RHSIM_Rhsim08G0179800 [Rhododendron simsii]|uniref:Gag-pol polyprotein n=1 Tax=Rhododendron simsii TaxID=118357 RepID=A0A834LFZ3_RHOSS|nr:hypothetical protein RHSIM_Rhsim08G0179800 [Rhododendron simsii]